MISFFVSLFPFSALSPPDDIFPLFSLFLFFLFLLSLPLLWVQMELRNFVVFVALAENDVQAAEAYLGRASEATNYNDLLAALQVSKGNYAAAAANAKTGKSNTAALALLLNKDYATAITVLTTMPRKTAMTDYLKAVCYARQNRPDAVVNSLSAAFAKDASLRVRAAKDLEFARFVNRADFKALF